MKKIIRAIGQSIAESCLALYNAYASTPIYY